MESLLKIDFPPRFIPAPRVSGYNGFSEPQTMNRVPRFVLVFLLLSPLSRGLPAWAHFITPRLALELDAGPA